MTEAVRVPKPTVQRVVLPDGTPAGVRPIRPDGGPQLAKALRRWSPESRQRRFLYAKGTFSPNRVGGLHTLRRSKSSGPGAGGDRFRGTGTSTRRGHALHAGCGRHRTAEVAIAVADDWQHRGVGKLLIQALAKSAWAVGIRRWNAVLSSDNLAMRKLLELVGQKQSEQSEGDGVVEVIYSLFPPATA